MAALPANRKKRPRPRPKLARARRGAEREIAAPPWSILIVGAGPRTTRVRGLLRRLGFETRVASDPNVALELHHDATRLMVIVPPLPDLSAQDLCRRLRRPPHRSKIPILVVGSPPRQSRLLYRAGASGLFEWPGERAAFVRTVLRLVGPGADRQTLNPRDQALAARIEERLRAERETFGPFVTARVQRGVVLLGGEVDAAWKISELGRVLSAMSGVDEVVTSGIRVPVSGVPDRAVARSIRSTLKSAAGLDERTFQTRVSKGRVILTGTARSRRELNRVVGLIEQVDGVRGVENLAVVSWRAKRRDGTVAANLTRLLRNQFPRTRVDVSVFGRITVLSGKARDAAERRAIESLVSTHPKVDQVVSKIG